MFFNKYKIYLYGGIGNQILNLLIQIEKAIKESIEPSNIEIVICKYDKAQKNRLFHNAEDLTKYISLNKKIKLSITFNKPKKKQKLNKENANKIIFSLSNNYLYYFNVLGDTYKNSIKKHNFIWIRGGDRKFNVEKIDEILKIKFKGIKFNVLTNDKSLVSNFPLLKKKLVGGDSLIDFKYLMNSKLILSQFSAFSIVPFLLSKQSQKIYIPNKNYHCRDEFPYIDEDWIFLETLLIELNQKNPKKEFYIID